MKWLASLGTPRMLSLIWPYVVVTKMAAAALPSRRARIDGIIRCIVTPVRPARTAIGRPYLRYHPNDGSRIPRSSLFERVSEMTSRLIAASSTVLGVVGLCVYSGALVSGQQPRATPPAMVITAFGGKAVDYKAPRTPWGDPDLQGVWSSDNMEGTGMAARGAGAGGRGGRGAPAAAAPAPAAAAPAGPPPLYRTEAEMKAREEQVRQRAARGDGPGTDGAFRFDYARRAFPQTRLIVDPPDGRLPTILPAAQNRGMPRGTYGQGPLNSWLDFSTYE